MNFLEPNDDELLWIPACPPVVPFRHDPRGEEKSLFPQSREELKYALHRKTFTDFDRKTGTLIVQLYRNRPDWSDLKHALAHVRGEGYVVKQILMLVSQQVFIDYGLEFSHRHFERDEGLERTTGNGQFVLIRKMKVPTEKPIEKPTEASA